MSISVLWEPVGAKKGRFENGTSSEYNAITKVIGNTISEEDIPILRAMAVAANSKFFDEVADIVEKIGGINIWSEY